MDYSYLEKEVKKKKDKRQIIRDEIKKTTDTDLKSKLRELLVKNIQDLNGSNVYKISYDSIVEGLEPIYFWILDFLKDSPPGGVEMEEVDKYKDEYDASVGSGYFSDLGTKASVMQDRAMKIMATINTVVRSIINLIYDLREFSIRLGYYDELHAENSSVRQSARLALKQTWMDQVDIKKSRGSINALSQQLEFVTLRDAFLAVESPDKVDEIDLNDRVRRILKARLLEYLEWEKNSEKELRKRFNIERSYLKSQVASLKHYTAWVKPYLIAAKRLGTTPFSTKSGMPSPHLVNAFSTMEMHLTLFAKKEIKPESVSPSYAALNIDKKFYACIEVDIIFRTIPRSVQGQYTSHYVHAGRTDLIFRTFSLSDEEIKEIYRLKEQEDYELIEEMTSVSLKEIQEDIDIFLKDDDEIKLEKLRGKDKINLLKKKLASTIKEEDRRKIHREIDDEYRLMKQGGVDRFISPFGNINKGFKQAVEPVRYLFGMFGFKHVMPSPERNIRVEAKKVAETKCYILYDIFKKAHGMLTW